MRLQASPQREQDQHHAQGSLPRNPGFSLSVSNKERERGPWKARQRAGLGCIRQLGNTPETSSRPCHGGSVPSSKESRTGARRRYGCIASRQPQRSGRWRYGTGAAAGATGATVARRWAQAVALRLHRVRRRPHAGCRTGSGCAAVDGAFHGAATAASTALRTFHAVGTRVLLHACAQNTLRGTHAHQDRAAT